MSIAFLGIGVFLSRIPFLGPGYGTDADGWRMAQAARSLATTGEYVVSRFPGYPLPEVVMAAFWGCGPIVINGLTALLSTIAAVYFALILREASVKTYISTTIAFAASPVVFVNSVVAMDYLWALAFILAAIYSAMRRRWTVTGVMVGLAIGCRLTSAVIGLPLLLYLHLDRNRPIEAMRFVLSSAVVAAIAWSPVVYNYGLDFLTHYGGTYPDAIGLARRMTVELFGRLGVFAFVALALGLVLFPGLVARTHAELSSIARQITRLWFGSLAVFVATFLLFPYQTGYLLPAVPFVLLIAATFLRPACMRILCICIVLTAFIQPCRRAIICDGAIISSLHQRQDDTRIVQRILSASHELPPDAILVCAWWLPKIDISRDTNQAGLRLAYLVDSTLLRAVVDSNIPVYYLEDAVVFNANRYGIALPQIGSKLALPPES